MKFEFLKIYTSRLQEQLEFYRDVLGFSSIEISEDSFQLQMGYTRMLFQQKKDSKPYHIAFHIPAHQEFLALEWLKKRVKIEKDEAEEIIDFSNWNAKSVYFKDPDSNIMECISRRHLFLTHNDEFNASSFMGVAEIGMAVRDIEVYYKKLHHEFELKIFDGGLDPFCAIGDENGLIICINREQKDWFPTQDPAYKADFDITFRHNEKTGSFLFKNDRIYLED
ncbi:VOC family protein [Zunongwangia endophytica]|uniref:VOC family protein n=1 Tax=Zunongwangia endophytica TaxID=1808945 RepID=A0ABV8HDI4_9FLAO|nr:VOC family protein [Zunongwangia endophytica]MDN3596618.1 VOC family protein [Zunongwangia endophytica]